MDETAPGISDTQFERARKLLYAEVRARALVDSAVARAMHEVGEPDERDYRRFAHDVATLATTLLLQQIYENDAELLALREQVKRLEEIAFVGLMTKPPSFVVPSALAGIETGTAETVKQGSVPKG